MPKRRTGTAATDFDRKEFLLRASKASLAVAAASELNNGIVPANAAQATVAPGGWLHLKDFGAVGDGVADDAPALQRALDALGAQGGGELIVSPGTFALRTPVRKNFIDLASSIRLVGHGSASQLLIKCDPGAYVIELGNLQHLTIQGVVFVGTPGVRNDGNVIVYLSYCDVAVVRDCDFYGLGSIDSQPGAIVYTNFSDLLLERCAFRGSAANGVVMANNWVGFRAEDCLFLDYGSLNGTYHSKTLLGGGAGWIQALAPVEYPLHGTNSQGVFTIRNVKADEGARALWVNPGTSRVARVHIDGLDSNAPPTDEAVWITKADSVVVENSFIGYASGPVIDAVRLTDVKEALISRTFCLQSANRITADPGCGTLTVVESAYTTLRSNAATTNVVSSGKGGVVPKTKAGAISDADFEAPPPDGTLAVDTTNSRLYVRVGGTWRSTALTSDTPTTTTPPTTTPPSSAARSIWPESARPGTFVAHGSPYELGVKFRADVAGTVDGVRFYKAPGDPGMHVGKLWSRTGALLASVSFSGESSSGWQQARFATPVAIDANTTYVASFHSSLGHFGFDSNFFTTAVDSPPLHALASGTDGPNGVYLGGPGGFPTQSYLASNFWVDVIFAPSAG